MCIADRQNSITLGLVHWAHYIAIASTVCLLSITTIRRQIIMPHFLILAPPFPLKTYSSVFTDGSGGIFLAIPLRVLLETQLDRLKNLYNCRRNFGILTYICTDLYLRMIFCKIYYYTEENCSCHANVTATAPHHRCSIATWLLLWTTIQ
jgi:hypothetical protein